MPDQKPSRSEELLSASLQRLARTSPEVANPELQRTLVRAFHRHHHHRRVMRFTAVAALCVVAVSTFAWWIAHGNQPLREQVAMTQQQAVDEALRQDPSAFTALPAFALRTPEEELRIVRVEIPVSSLRLLGARVNDELITQQIVADLLVGTDGTPYAFRIIS